MKLVTNPSDIPNPKHKTKSTPLDEYEPYLQLRHMILEGKMKPLQQVGIFFGPEDQKKLEMKWPWRTAADRIRRFLKEIGASSDYDVRKYETDTPGVWFVRVTYDPPRTGVTVPKRRQRSA